MGFNYNAFREANKITLTLVKRTINGQGQTTRRDAVDRFTAYTMQDFDINVAYRMSEGLFDSMMGKANEYLPYISRGAGMIANTTENKAWKEALANIQGLGHISYSKHGSYKGTSTLSLPITCYLAVTNGGTYQTDVLDNLEKIIGWLLPTRGNLDGEEELGRLNSGLATVGDNTEAWVREKMGNDSWLADIAKGLFSAASSALEAARIELGDVYSLNLPLAFDGNHYVNFEWGGWELSDVIIKNLSVKVPTIKTINGKPDCYEVKFNVETSHEVDADMLKQLYRL